MRKGLNLKMIIYIILAVMLAISLFPFLVTLITSLKDVSEVYTSPPTWIPVKPTFKNYREVFERYPMARYFLNSFIIAIGATLLNAAFSIPAAYATARLRFRGKKFFMYLLLMVQMFSPIIIIIALFRQMSIFGLLNSYLGLILVNAVFTLTFSIWMLSAYFLKVPFELEESAMIDGCNRFQAIVKILIPLAMPGLTATMIYTFINAWNEFVFALTFTTTPEMRPLTVGLYSFVGRWSIQWQYITTASILGIVPIVLLFMLVEKQLMSGLMGGAIKG
ncbi:MAG: carbohydrate ABC transporter permease [Candidatus Humimicrobiaceae bacterium]